MPLYAMEAGSVAASQLVSNMDAPPIISWLCEVEFSTAVQLRVFRREIAARDARTLQGRFELDLARHVYQVQAMSREVFATATELANQHSATLGVRSLDILHVAAAMQSGGDAFWTFDQRQARLARAARLKTLR